MIKTDIPRWIVDGFSLLGIGLTVVSLRGDFKEHPIIFVVMFLSGALVMGMGIGLIFYNIFTKNKRSKK